MGAPETLLTQEKAPAGIAASKLAPGSRALAQAHLDAALPKPGTRRLPAEFSAPDESGRNIGIGAMKDRFRARIGRLKALGFSVQVFADIACESSQNEDAGLQSPLTRVCHTLETEIAKHFRGKGNPPEIVWNQTPLRELLEGETRELLGKELRGDSRVVSTPFSLEVARVPGGKLRVQVQDWLRPERPILFESCIADRPEAIRKACGRILETLNAPENRPDLLQKRLDAIPADAEAARTFTPALWTNHTGPSPLLSPRTKATLDALLKRTESDEFRITCRRRGSEIDRYENLGVVAPSPVFISTEALRAGPLMSTARDICLQISLPSSCFRQVNPAYARTIWDGQGDTFRAKVWRDRFGNSFSLRPPGERRTSCTLSIMPQYPFARPGGNGVHVPVPIDLAALGLGVLENLLYVKPETMLGRTGEKGCYGLYSEIEGKEARDFARSLSEPFAAGASRAERLFGVQPGTRVRNILVVNSEDMNAIFSGVDPSLLTIYSRSYQDLAKQNTGVHEAVHLLDHQLGISRPGSSFAETFLDRSQTFLDALNEERFMKYARGGHAGDGADEFLASLISGLVHPDWTEIMTAKSEAIRTSQGQKAADDFLSEYAISLDALETRLHEIPALQLDSGLQTTAPARRIPLQDLINQRRQSLTTLLQRSSRVEVH